MGDRLLTIQELSRRTGWSVLTLYHKSSIGEIPGRVKLGSRSLRFKESIIEQWLDSMGREE